jgi:hypothetical protein
VISVTIRVGETTEVDFRNRQIGRITDGRPAERQAPGSRLVRLQRTLGVRRHKIVLTTPATGHASTYHVDAEAPEGLQFSGTRLVHARSVWEKGQLAHEEYAVDEEVESVQRTHLYLPNAPQQGSGVLTLRLLPRPGTVARAAFFTSALTALLLWAIAWRHDAIGPNAGSVATLILFGTGSLSAYVARPREHRMASVLAQGTRGLALISGLAGLIGAVVIVLDRDWRVAGTTSVLTPGTTWSAAAWVVFGTGVVSAVCALVAGLAWRRARRAEKVVQNAT